MSMVESLVCESVNVFQSFVCVIDEHDCICLIVENFKDYFVFVSTSLFFSCYRQVDVYFDFSSVCYIFPV